MHRTKKALVESFRELLLVKPVNKITVQDIVDGCGVNRNTFYYHFDDIPALVQEHLTERCDMLLSSPENRTPLEILLPIVRHFKTHRKSVLNIYHHFPRDQFLPYLEKVCAYFVDTYLMEIVTKEELSPREMDLLSLYYKGLVMGISLDWLDGDLSYDMEEKLKDLCFMLKGTTKKAISNLRAGSSIK